jgi:transcriptional regulator with XRE-family HTH domain
MALTPTRLAKLAGVKKNQLVRYEAGERHLSLRDQRRLTAVFEVAGAEIFQAQGALQVLFNKMLVIDNGKVAQVIRDLKRGEEFCDMRYERWGPCGWMSQKFMARQSGVSQHIISAIENDRPRKYHLSQLLQANQFLQETPVADHNPAYDDLGF